MTGKEKMKIGYKETREFINKLDGLKGIEFPNKVAAVCALVEYIVDTEEMPADFVLGAVSFVMNGGKGE